ncbi:MAG: hypothetical protein SFU86_00155 [Pirellulaceae bacterium]|nr:hypothetical protein [Pirellulaceae bacterium]
MFTSLLLLTAFAQVPAQNVRPQIGYVYPPGGKAGTTVEVMLGTYDWTPDVQILPVDPRVKIEITGPMGDFILTPPPYWFGLKAGQAQPPLAREVPARITLPADLPPGPIQWRVASANGGSNVGTFVVGDGAEFVEPEQHAKTLDLPALPVVANGRISRITEIDTYRFTVADAGLVTVQLSDRIGQPFHGSLTIRDAAGKVVADGAGTTGDDVVLLFTAQAGTTYTATVTDLEFAGDRGYVYRLSINRGPRVLTTLPLVVKRGETVPVEIIGWGVATGALKVETITKPIAVPADNKAETFLAAVDTPAGPASVTLALSDAADQPEPASADLAARQLAAPLAISATFDALDKASNLPLDRYQFSAKKGDALHIRAEAARFGSAVDPSLVIVAVAEGKEIIRNDDLPTSSDAAVDFKCPADGVYDLLVSDVSGLAPSRASTYRLVVENPAEAFDFMISALDKLDLPLGGTADLVVKTSRRGVWDDPIEIKLEGLPAGVTVPAEPPPPPEPMPAPGAKKVPKPKKPAPGDIKVPLVAAADAACASSLVTIVATATVGDKTLERRFGPILVTSTLKTRCVVKSAVQDGGRIVNRGTTYPADVLLERLEGYEGPVTLQMAATQQRQRRGIRSDAIVVPAGADRAQFPIFTPEWLETSLTCRMNVVGIVQVKDPKGNLRYITGIMDGLIVMSMEGALLKISHEPEERIAQTGSTFEIPVRVSRSVKMPVEARVELVADPALPGLIAAEPIVLAANQSAATVKLRLVDDPRLLGRRSVTIRATALQNGKWPAISETTIPLVIEARPAVAAK